MTYNPMLDEDEDDSVDSGDETDSEGAPEPVNTVAGPQTTRDLVSQRISQVRSGGGDPSDQATGPSQQDSAALQFAQNANQTAGIGRAINALASGTGYKADNSGYEQIEKQGGQLAEKELARSAAVKNAIASRNFKQGIADQRLKAVADNQARQQKNFETTARLKQRELDQKSQDQNNTKADKMALALKTDLDPNAGRAGNLGFNQKKVDSADRLMKLVEQGKAQPGSLDKRQMEELAIGLNSMLSNSSTGAASQVEALVPHTWRGEAQDLKEFLTNDPKGRDQQAFVDRIADTIQRERDVASDQVKAAQVQRLSAHGKFKDKDPETYWAILQSYGIDPERIKDGKYVAPARGKSGGPGQGSESFINNAMADDTPKFNEEDLQHFKLAKERLAKNPNDEVAKRALAIAASKGLR